MKKSREELAEGIISKLIDTFYDKKAKAYQDIMMQADPEIGKAADALLKAKLKLKDKLMNWNKKNKKWLDQMGIKPDRDGSISMDQIKKAIDSGKLK
jgi:flagellar biosynthesis chaperone FliJ|tara:strand:- start:191 stop:481 length:291 start_codon:yes stop_codon:yes gene_type:complete